MLFFIRATLLLDIEFGVLKEPSNRLPLTTQALIIGMIWLKWTLPWFVGMWSMDMCSLHTVDVESAHEAFDVLCRAGASFSDAFSSISFMLVFHAVYVSVWDGFTVAYYLNKATVAGHMIYWLTVDVVSLIIICRAADVPAYQVSHRPPPSDSNNIQCQLAMFNRSRNCADG